MGVIAGSDPRSPISAKRKELPVAGSTIRARMGDAASECGMTNKTFHSFKSSRALTRDLPFSFGL